MQARSNGADSPWTQVIIKLHVVMRGVVMSVVAFVCFISGYCVEDIMRHSLVRFWFKAKRHFYSINLLSDLIPETKLQFLGLQPHHIHADANK